MDTAGFGSPVGFENSTLADGFWKEEQDLMRRVTLGAVYDRFRETGRVDSVKLGWKEGEPFRPGYSWDSNLTKWIEGAACFLAGERDAQLEARVDAIVDDMEKEQEADGYLNTYYTVVEPGERFKHRTEHELYCAGHLFEAAVAYAKATGKTKLLDIAERYADLIDRVFRVEHSAAFSTPGHEEIETALIRLYRYTGKKKYLTLAEYFLNARGTEKEEYYPWADSAFDQSHLPVRQQRTAEGHAVRMLYLLMGMADEVRETGDEEMLEACRTVYENITEKRMYITGGVGSTWHGEAFSGDYDLPEETAYAETCASIALAFFCRRMWLLDEKGTYADTAEQALYNTVLSGVSLSGDRFFYENPLMLDPARSRWFSAKPEALRERLPITQRLKVFDCSCCPPNLLRCVGSIGDFLYSVNEKENCIFAQCYMAAETEFSLGGRTVCLRQETDYPYDGRIRFTVLQGGAFSLALRIPGWCEQWFLSLNGTGVASFAADAPVSPVKNGFLTLKREWKDGETVEIDLGMGLQFVSPNPFVTASAGRIAVMRGPVVYCAEEIDNENVPVRNIRICRDADWGMGWSEISGMRIPVLQTEGRCPAPMQALYSTKRPSMENVTVTLIPYRAFANRGETAMTVWLLEDESIAGGPGEDSYDAEEGEYGFEGEDYPGLEDEP